MCHFERGKDGHQPLHQVSRRNNSDLTARPLIPSGKLQTYIDCNVFHAPCVHFEVSSSVVESVATPVALEQLHAEAAFERGEATGDRRRVGTQRSRCQGRARSCVLAWQLSCDPQHNSARSQCPLSPR